MKNYYLYALLTLTTHVGCTHSQQLNIEPQGSSSSNEQSESVLTAEQQRAVAFCELMQKFVTSLSFGASSFSKT